MQRHASLDTAEGIAQTINAALAPLFQGYKFKAAANEILNSNSVGVDFYQVPPTAGRLDTLNAPVNIRVFITSAEGKQTSWPVGGPTPALIMAETLSLFPRTTPKLRAIKGPPEKVVKSVIDFFRKNADVLKSPPVKLASSLSRILSVHQAKQAGREIKPKELEPEAQKILALAQRAGLKFSNASNTIAGQIVNFRGGTLKADVLRQFLQNPTVRWVAFDEDDAEALELKVVGGVYAGHWRFSRGPDFAALAAYLTTHPVLKYKGFFSIGC